MVLIKALLFLCVAVYLADAKYQLFKNPKNYQDAVDHCKSLQMTLIIPKTMAKNQEVYGIIRKNGLRNTWIGVSRRHKPDAEVPPRDGDWRYEGQLDEPMGPTFWGYKEPNNIRRQEYCVEVRHHEKNKPRMDTHNWNDQDCDNRRPYICETN